VNKRGGYCSIKPEEINDEEYYFQLSINEQELYNYLLLGEINAEFKITGETVILENSPRIPTEVLKRFCNLTKTEPDEIQIITHLKLKGLLFKDSDWFRLFREGKERGLKNIVFATSAQDKSQLKDLQNILEELPSKGEVINIYADISFSGGKYFKNLEYDKRKLNLILIER
jgi:hypothetical protein